MARFYARQLRAGVAARGESGRPLDGVVGTIVPSLTPVVRPEPVAPLQTIPYFTNGVTDPGDIAEQIGIDAILGEDIADLLDAGFEGQAIDDDQTVPAGEADGDEAGEPRRRRRRRRGGRGRGVEGVAETAADTAAQPDEEARVVEFDEEFVPDVPPSSHLAAMVQSGGLVLPQQRASRRRRGSGDREMAPPLTPFEPAARAPETVLPSREARGRKTSVEDELLKQSVFLDQMLQRQTHMVKTLDRMMMALERTSGGGGAGGAGVVIPQRTGVFVDVPNIVYAAERIGLEIDWGKVLHYLTRDRQLVRATAYAPVSDDPYQRVEMQKFVRPFHDLPFRILTKPLKRFGNGEIKANFDVELAIDVVMMADRLDVVCLISGDGDFRRMVEMAQIKGARVEVIAFSSSTAGELRAVCDEYIDITQHQHEFCVTR